MNTKWMLPVLAGLLLGARVASAADTIPVGEPDQPLVVRDIAITYGGFVKLDVLFSLFSDGDVSSLDQGRDYFRPIAIPVASSAAAEDGHSFLDWHVKDSRFFFRMDATLRGHHLGGNVELDFRTVAGGASEVATNAYNPRIRRGYVEYDEWTLGQDWTTFRNAESVPEHIDDLSGPVEALTIVRQPLLRYTWTATGLQLALENSETALQPNAATVNGATPVTGTFVTGDAQVPDFVARYDRKTGFGTFGFAALGRQLAADQARTGGDAPNAVADGTAFAWGLNASGKIPVFAADDIRFTFNYGDGIGRYVALGTIADAVVDAGGGLDPIAVASGHVSYRHAWTPRWRSTVTLADLEADNPAGASAATTSAVRSGHVNLIWTPVDKVLFGLEYMHAVREVESGQDGTLDRVQFSTKYSF